MKLNDLMDGQALCDEIETGYVRRRVHPLDADLVILNYTEKVQYEKHWNEVTRQCRGLIYDRKTGEVLARPFEKFFNLGEHADGTLDLFHPVEVTDKMDGSLGIVYPAPDGLAIATRGSFTSEQAIHATHVLRSQYGDWRPVEGWTYLFEIIYPENRIVLDYGGIDDLVLIGARHVEEGLVVGSNATGWPGGRAERFEARTLHEALEMPPRPNAEGLVVRYLDTDLMVKIKQEDYVRLHKLVTGLNERAVWEHMLYNGYSAMGLIQTVPDEFHAWVIEVANGLSTQAEVKYGRAWEAYHNILTIMRRDPDTVSWDREDRKAFAGFAREMGDLTPLLFQLLDGRDISNAIWRSLRPVGETKTLMDRNEDNS